MAKQLKVVKKWDEIPDMMGTQDFADAVGCCLKTAREKFNSKGFPKVTNGRVNKYEVMKYLGIKDDKTSESTILAILLEMQKDIKELKQEQTRKLELLKQVI